MNISKFLPYLRVACKAACSTCVVYNQARVRIITRDIGAGRPFNMAQRTITSFFKATPPKATVKDEKVEVDTKEDVSSPEKIEKKPLKRARLESSGSEPETAKTTLSQLPSDKKKKSKRLRIESTDSETELTPDNPSSPKSPDKPAIKLEKASPKTYQSPKTKKTKPLSEKNIPKAKSPQTKMAPEVNSPKIKTKLEKSSPKSSKKVKKESKTKTEVIVNGDGSPESSGRASSSGDESPSKENVKAEPVELVPELEYDPSKGRYDPVRDACWRAGQPVPYLALARTLQAIEGTSARLKMIDILANYLRSVIVLTPQDLLPSVYLCLNQLAPAYHSLELGIAETYLMKAVGACTGRSLAAVRAAARAAGDLASVAAAARSAQRMLRAPPPLAVRHVFHALKDVAAMTGQSSVNKKIQKIQSLYVSCRDCEAKFLIRSLEGKLRIGLAEQSVLQALAVAVTLTPPGDHAPPKLSPEALKARIDENALTIKTVYCECPNYDAVIAALLQHGVASLPAHCGLTCGVPLKPMLAHPTKRIDEIFSRFEGVTFTCEWKYDGERAQIHVPSTSSANGTNVASGMSSASGPNGAGEKTGASGDSGASEASGANDASGASEASGANDASGASEASGANDASGASEASGANDASGASEASGANDASGAGGTTGAGDAIPDFTRAAVFSRNQENNTSKYPDILRRLPALLKPSVRSCILDCEAVAYDVENKQILPFQVLSTRKRKDADSAEIRVQVCVFVFDLLLLNDEPLVRRPLRHRRDLLREHFNEVPGEWEFARSKDCTSMEEVQQFLEEAVKGSCEGLMVKTLTGDHAHYHIARRSKNWLKLKKDYLEGVGDTIDVVVLGAYRGRGRRAGTYGGFLCFTRDGDTEEFQCLCKIGTGFTDEDLVQFTEELDHHKIDGPRSYYSYDKSLEPDSWFSAAVVWEIRCADLSLSPLHRAAAGLVDRDKGISVRFPRFLRRRTDKAPEDATSARQIADMYLQQDQLKNMVNKPQVDLDDFY